MDHSEDLSSPPSAGVRFLFAFCAIAFFGSSTAIHGAPSAIAQDPRIHFPSGPEVSARSTILLDFDSGVVLFEKDADLSIPPASLTKVAALHAVFAAASEGALDLDAVVTIPEEAWSVNAPPGSSLMFLGPDQQASIRELITGLIVASGNDAAVALAHYTSGGVDRFVERMNREMDALGLRSLRFADASGYSARSSITAREFALFLREFVRRRPASLSEFFSVKEITYPKARNRTAGNSDPEITQQNRNSLLWDYPGADGFKTGYIGASGHNLAFTAARDGRRLIGVVLSAQGATYQEGYENRFADAARLLDFGFDSFTTLVLRYPTPQPVRVWKGNRNTVAVIGPAAPVVTIPRELVSGLSGTMEYRSSIEAPVTGRMTVGQVVFMSGGQEIARFALHPADDVERGSILKRAADSLRLFIRRLFRGEEPVVEIVLPAPS